MGLTFLLDDYLPGVTACFLAVSVGALGFRAGRRRGYGPFAVGLLAGVLLLAGKFALDSDVAVYGAIALLVAASVWNAWPPPAPAGPLLQLGDIRREENGDETKG
jgi:hypothetical protein